MAEYETRQRERLLAFLMAHPDEALTAREIASALSGEGISASAVYRNLAAQTAAGRVRKMTRAGSAAACYRYVGASACRDHLHLNCTACGRTFHAPVALSRALMDEVDRGTAFRVDGAGTVLYGVCADCREKE